MVVSCGARGVLWESLARERGLGRGWRGYEGARRHAAVYGRGDEAKGAYKPQLQALCPAEKEVSFTGST